MKNSFLISNSSVTINSNYPYNGQLKNLLFNIEMRNGRVELPISFRGILNVLPLLKNTSNISIKIPCYYDYYAEKTILTANSIYRNVIETFDSCVYKIKSKDNVVYYAIGSDIYDCDLKPLLVTTLDLENTSLGFNILNFNTKIDCCVAEREDVLCKALKSTLFKKLIGDTELYPSLLNTLKPESSYKYLFTTQKRSRVVIEDLSYLVSKPTVPTATTTSESISKFLIDNIDEFYNSRIENIA